MSAKTHVVLVAGGGMTAALPQIESLLTHSPGTHVLLFYGNRTAAQVEGLEAVQALKDRFLARLSLFFLFSADPQEVELLNGALDAAKLRELAGTLFDVGEVDEFVLAGPNGAVAEFASALASLGVPSARLRALGSAPASELGGTSIGSADAAAAPAAPRWEPGASPAIASPASAPVQPLPPEQTHSGEAVPQAAARDDVTEVTVNLDGRRRSFTMAREDATVLEAAEAAGLDLPFSCRAGVCSTCRTKVVKGAVEMMQNYALEPWEVEEGYILACQSHPTTAELELDYDDK